MAVGFATKFVLKQEGFKVSLKMRGGHGPCRCDKCSERSSVEATSAAARSRLLRIWGAKSRLWPPRVPVPVEEEQDKTEDDLAEIYARQGGAPQELPPRRERKLKPNPRSQQALLRRKSKLRLKSAGAVRKQVAKKRGRSPSATPRPASVTPVAGLEDRAASEVSLDVNEGSRQPSNPTPVPTTPTPAPSETSSECYSRSPRRADSR